MIDSAKILITIPKGLRDPLLSSYQDIVSNYIEHRWEPSELNGGKFSEVVFTIIDGALKGSFSSKPHKPANMLKACQGLEMLPANPHRVGDRSLRILLPRMLPVLYEIRNNRGVGHVGGDVDPNLLDATAVHSLASWVLAELIRVFHNISIKEAQEAVNILMERIHPLIWEIDDVRRVMDPSMAKSDQALLLLYQVPGWVSEDNLLDWVEYTDIGKFRTRILQPLHKERFLEYDQNKRRVHISPLGTQEVEGRIIQSRHKN